MAMQVVFFVGWAGVEEYGRINGVEFLLETRPVDPRDFLSGLYMTLGYSFMDPEGSVPGREALVRLDFEREVTVDGETFPVWRAALKSEPSLVADRRLTATSGWASASVEGGRLDYGIDRYYFSEARQEELSGLRGGRFYVLVRLGPDGMLRVRDLIWESETGN
jgi:uncharacterized membrane-anchored protein